MAGSLEGRVAAITGASSGIGEATALAFAREGAAVALGARRSDRIEELARRIEADGGRAAAITVDVTDERQAHAFVSEAHDRLGGLDALINNAGLMLLGPIEDADTDQWRRMVDVNVLGLLYCTQAALPLMREGGGGNVVNVSSVAGRVGNPGSAVYNATKWAVVGFSEALRKEAAPSNVRVTCIEPGYVRTELQGHNEDPGVRQAIERMEQEIGDVLEAEDMAESILFVVAAPPRMAVNEMLIRPAGQIR
ncbi:MAG TPA: SDR family NAD(P)-dependent oxidoreductase [Thermoleophilaceae bacterium]|nr:SDR family NAD(P)-dependent oxidoreductase [Thermoleophilaceae bacterium]